MGDIKKRKIVITGIGTAFLTLASIVTVGLIKRKKKKEQTQE